jgi:hypothetical protein
MQKNSIQCVTSPTTTPNSSDLYLQFNANKCGDVSRIQFKKTKISVWCTANVVDLFKNDIKVFDTVNDGSARKNRFDLPNTVDNFKFVFEKFFNNGIVKMLPTT